ncbi:MAG: SdpI family protein [Gammaproteobacteria bacterium]|nr:SdpI family protein [Gammaproteobacteria bacterium]
MTFLIRNALSIVCLLIMIVFSFYIYGSLPEQVPTGYSLAGEPTETTPRLLMATLIPLIYATVIVLINPLIKLSPEKYSMPNSKYAIDIIVFGTGVLMVSIHIALLVANGDYSTFLSYFSQGFAAFFLITGNVVGKTEQNFIIGLRLPWTLASNSNWKVTHRLAGRMMVVFGLLLLVSNSFYPSLIALLVFSVSPLVIALLYSPYYYFKYERQGRSQGYQIG